MNRICTSHLVSANHAVRGQADAGPSAVRSFFKLGDAEMYRGLLLVRRAEASSRERSSGFPSVATRYEQKEHSLRAH